MARVVNEAEREQRRNEIIDIAQRLIYTRGYEQMTVQDILNELNISKGAFYHYFTGKPELLEAIIERMWEQIRVVLTPVVDDPDMGCIEKLRRLFDVAAGWKTARKELMVGLMRAWYTDENALLRQKVQSVMVRRVAAMYADIVRQGIAEGILHTAHPDLAAGMIINLMIGLGDHMADILLHPENYGDAHDELASAIEAYSEAMERVLGVTGGSLRVMDPAMIKSWVPPPVAQTS